MELVVNTAEAVPADVRVDLRRRDLAVAEHELDRAQVGAALEQVGRERMTEDVRADLGREPGAGGVLAEELPNALPGEWTAAAREEELFAPVAVDERPDLVEIAAHGPAGGAAER